MYANASYWRKLSDERDERDEQEDNELGRVNPKDGEDLAAAGVKRQVSYEFVGRVKDALNAAASEGIRESGHLAGRLNSLGVLNAKGLRWTAVQIKIFDDRYTKLRLHF